MRVQVQVRVIMDREQATPGDGGHDKVFITHCTPEVLERPGPRVTDRSSPPLLNAQGRPARRQSAVIYGLPGEGTGHRQRAIIAPEDPGAPH